MSYDGLEIDMLNLGDADCILVTRWNGGIATRVMIDGGNAGTVDTVRAFLIGRGIKVINHVVCTHPHDDHAAGLIELLKDKQFSFMRLWMHHPLNHIDGNLLNRAWSQGKAAHVIKILRRSLETQNSLAAAARARGIPMDQEPFKGAWIGPLFVCGPSKEFYRALLLEFSNLEKLAHFESDLEADTRSEELDDALEGAGLPRIACGLLDEPHTQPENESSTILWINYEGETFLFTSDAGVAALRRVKTDFEIGNCTWMQMPHHGSRHNITKSLIQYFSPKIAYASAAGNPKHPRRAVVNAYKEHGAKTYSTHYPKSSPLWLHRGTVPPRPDYSAATLMYEATT